jgi:hypothetical protein
LTDPKPADPAAYEAQLRSHLHELQKEFYAKAKPILDELVWLAGMKPPKPFLVTQDGKSVLPPLPSNITAI